jgi:hypothetical protein
VIKISHVSEEGGTYQAGVFSRAASSAVKG